MEIAGDYRRTKEVLRRLIPALRTKSIPYWKRETSVPQSLIPKNITDNPLLHALQHFFNCFYMRGAIKSDMAIQKLVEMQKIYPELFIPREAARMKLASLAEILTRYVNYHVQQIAGFWIRNSTHLQNAWGGDPRNIFHDIPSASEVRRRFIFNANAARPRHRGFEGVQEKMTSMHVYFLEATALIPPIKIAPPVDFHILRVMLATRMIRVSKAHGVRYEQAVPFGVKLLERYLEEGNEGTMVEVGDALWLLSRELCRRAPGNTSTVLERGRQPAMNGEKFFLFTDEEAPVMTDRLPDLPSGRKRRLYFPVVDFGNGKTFSSFWNSCGVCPVRSLCAFNVPSSSYYVTGKFTLRPRQEPESKILI